MARKNESPISWLENAAIINNMHLINPPGNGDCLFYIICALEVLSK